MERQRSKKDGHNLEIWLLFMQFEMLRSDLLALQEPTRCGPKSCIKFITALGER